MPSGELDALLRNSRHRAFEAYVNIGSLGQNELERIASTAPVHLIITTERASSTMPSGGLGALSEGLGIPPHRRLVLPVDDPDPWEALARFLKCDYPTHPWPRKPELGQRPVAAESHPDEGLVPSARHLAWDTSPWTVGHRAWSGVALASSSPRDGNAPQVGGPTTCGGTTIAWSGLNDGEWYLRDDTFPGNRALFRPDNVVSQGSHLTSLTLRREVSKVRDLSGAAIASRRSFTYGTFAANLRVPSGSGLVAGLFLHRNGPRQEIDIEFLGRDTTQMLVNVFYNPGTAGTKLEYGYRGTPVLVELGFDASEAFHSYEIEWQPESIRWHVDGVTVYERLLWGPTPIPDQPMEFNVNLWSSESAEFAGPLGRHVLPAVLEVASLEAHYATSF